MEIAEKKSSKIPESNGSAKHTSINVNPEDVQATLKKHMIVDGLDVILDLHKSEGIYIYDSKSQRKFLDFFTFVASNTLGMNHPRLNTPEFREKLGAIAVNKPSLSDIYAKEQAEFVETFFNIAVPDYFKYSFFVEGGAMAVENALKAAFDWKVQKNFKKGYKEEKGHQVLHFMEAFHGRSGYTMSLTNTDPNKIRYFPKFNWPRVANPKVTYPLNDENLNAVIEAEKKSIEQIKTAILNNKDDIASLILEPIQGEGGDNHFRKEFFQQLRTICDENDILLIFDEVQTGIALTGKWWAHQHYVQPDIISFGKKTQVCGILSTNRIDEIEENVFTKPSRINSTWGGNMVDMVRFTRILQIIEEENYVDNCKVMGDYLQSKIQELINKYPSRLYNGRGLGLFCSFDCINAEDRNKITAGCFENGMIILGCGEKTVRFRPPVCVNKQEIDMAMEILDNVVKGL